jgi:hypothetical protein
MRDLMANGNTGFFKGQSRFSISNFPETRLLDTLDHFDYDPACTMILNLEAQSVGRRN